MTIATGDLSPPSLRAILGWSDWRRIIVRTWKESARDNLNIVAAGVAFYAFLAVVPLLAALVLSYGLFADPASVVGHVQALTQVMPADAARLLGEQMVSITETASGQKGLGLALAILLSLYGAMRASTSIITALNIVYNVAEDRGYVRTTFLAFLLTVGALAALLLAVMAISVLGYVQDILPFASSAVHLALKFLFWAAAAGAISGLLAAIYRFAPNRPDAPWQWLTPGSVSATMLWLVATIGFGFYVANFSNYNATYGSLGAVIIFLTWLYLSAYIVLMGGELNSELERQARGAAARG